MDDLDDLLEELAAARAPQWGALDRYREFRQVFLGSDSGRRVFYEILRIAEIYKSPAVRGDPYETYLRIGEKNLALKILSILHLDPAQRPDRQQSTEVNP